MITPWLFPSKLGKFTKPFYAQAVILMPEWTVIKTSCILKDIFNPGGGGGSLTDDGFDTV